MNSNQKTTKEFFKVIQILYFALIAGQVIMALASFFVHQMGNFSIEDVNLKNIFIYVVLLFATGGFMSSNAMFRKHLNLAKSAITLEEKLALYRSALIIRYALLEGPSLFAIVVYFITGELLFLTITGLIIAFFLTIKPTIARAKYDLELNQNELE